MVDQRTRASGTILVDEAVVARPGIAEPGSFVALPLLRAVRRSFLPAWYLDNLIGHILPAGVSVAPAARRSASRCR